MKRIVLTLALSAITLAACSKYGPEQEHAAQDSGQQRVAGGPITAMPVANETLKDNVAVVHGLPQQVTYNLRCDLNSVGGVGLNPGVEGSLAQGQGVVFNGWVVDEQGTPPARVVIILEGGRSYGILVSTGADRPDVAEAFRSEAARISGIASLVDTTAIARGTYHVHLLVPDTGAACDTTKRVKVG
jgi:hypothetical protein